MKILLIEPFFGGSHAAWARSLQQHSKHQIEILSLPYELWQWRMRGGAITLAKRFNELASKPDLILATDMLDLATFKGITETNIPTLLYFHENQITYPRSPNERNSEARITNYGFINYTSALAATSCIFNTNFHKDSFIGALPNFLQRFPEEIEYDTVKDITEKSSVMPVGLNFAAINGVSSSPSTDRPLIIWNHRWEFDKNPEDFLKLLRALIERDVDFEVAVLGENNSDPPEWLQNRIAHWGYVDSYQEYLTWLSRGNILPVTSNHDFFGISVLEAVACGCYPILPKRLSYPEFWPPNELPELYYKDQVELVAKTTMLCKKQTSCPISAIEVTKKFDWNSIIHSYDDLFVEFCRESEQFLTNREAKG